MVTSAKAYHLRFFSSDRNVATVSILCAEESTAEVAADAWIREGIERLGKTAVIKAVFKMLESAMFEL